MLTPLKFRCPWLDVYIRGKSVAGSTDALLSEGLLRRFSSIAIPHVPRTFNPLEMELRGMPSMYINAAGQDPLREDARALAARAKAAHVPVTFLENPTGFHDWFIFGATLPLNTNTLDANLYLPKQLTLESLRVSQKCRELEHSSSLIFMHIL